MNKEFYRQYLFVNIPDFIIYDIDEKSLLKENYNKIQELYGRLTVHIISTFISPHFFLDTVSSQRIISGTGNNLGGLVSYIGRGDNSAPPVIFIENSTNTGAVISTYNNYPVLQIIFLSEV